MQKVSLKVTVKDGLFSNEYEVSIEFKNGENLTLFIDKSQVEERGGYYYINVNSTDEFDGERNVLLPSETLETLSRWIKIPSSSNILSTI